MGVNNTNRRGGTGGGGTTWPTGNIGDYLQIDALGNRVFAPIEIESTGDYFVHFSTGQDSAGRGSSIAPFKTIQYAISVVPIGSNIKVIKDDTVIGGKYVYSFTGNESLNYNGTITFQDCKLSVNLTDFNTYLIDNSIVKIEGSVFIDFEIGRFIRNTNPITQYTQSIKGVTIRANGLPIVLLGNTTPVGNSNSTISAISFDSCRFEQRNNTIFSDFFERENLNGSFFTFTNSQFSGFALNWNNDAWNVFSTIQKCGFYGTSQFGFMSTYIKVGRSNIAQGSYSRIPLIEDCNFDMLSLGGTDTRAIVITSNNTEITIRRCSFTRYKGTDRKSIFTLQSNVKIYAFSCTTFTPVDDQSSGSTMQLLPAGQFSYYDELPTYVR